MIRRTVHNGEHLLRNAQLFLISQLMMLIDDASIR